MDLKHLDPDQVFMFALANSACCSIEVMSQAKSHGFEMILGCHVGESDVLTQAGIQLWHWGEELGINWLSNELGLNAWLCGDWKSNFKLMPWRKELRCQSNLALQ